MKKQMTTTKTQLRVRTQVQGGAQDEEKIPGCYAKCFKEWDARDGVWDNRRNYNELAKCMCGCGKTSYCK